MKYAQILKNVKIGYPFLMFNFPDNSVLLSIISYVKNKEFCIIYPTLIFLQATDFCNEIFCDNDF